MLPTLAALVVSLPALLILRVAECGDVGHGTVKVDRHNQSRKGERMTLATMPVIKRGKVQW